MKRDLDLWISTICLIAFWVVIVLVVARFWGLKW